MFTFPSRPESQVDYADQADDVVGLSSVEAEGSDTQIQVYLNTQICVVMFYIIISQFSCPNCVHNCQIKYIESQVH